MNELHEHCGIFLHVSSAPQMVLVGNSISLWLSETRFREAGSDLHAHRLQATSDPLGYCIPAFSSA
jgi:hypothetical protein